jgi:hypothetical protein
MIEIANDNYFKGKGEFAWNLFRDDITINLYGNSDILDKNNHKFEVKCATKGSAGNLLFCRANYIGCNSSKHKKEYIKKLQDSLINFMEKAIPNNNDFEYVKSIITSCNIESKFSWNKSDGIYLNKDIIKKMTNSSFNEYVRYIYCEHTCHNLDNELLLNDIDLMNADNFKLWHFVNYCNYYLNFDAKKEELFGILFISNVECLAITNDVLKNIDYIKFKKEFNNFNITYPGSEITKDNKTNDRQKNRTITVCCKNK